MRISTGQINQQGIDSILESQTKFAKTQLQLSSGKRLTSPADDPSGASQLLVLDQTLSKTEQFQRNADTAKTRLNLEETTLVGVQTVLDRVRELAIQGTNASQNDQTRDSIALEIRQLLDELVDLANTRDSTNRFLFAGYQEQTQPFSVNSNGDVVYNGDDGVRAIQISDNRQIPSSDSGTDVFMAIPGGNGTFSVFDNTANRGSGVIDPGSVVNPSAYDGDTYSIVFPATTAATGTLTFGDQAPTDDTLQYSLSINGTTVYSVDETGTPAATLDELAAQINDDVGTTGVRAYVAGGTLYLANTNPGASTITVAEQITGGTAGEGDTITGYFGGVLAFDGTATNTLTFDDDSIDSYMVVDSQNNVETTGLYTDGARIEFAGIETNIAGDPALSDRYTVTPAGNSDIFSTIKDLADALESGAAVNPADRAQLSNAVNRAITGIDRAQDNMDNVRSRVGARLSALDSQQSLNDDFSLVVKETKSRIEDLDFVEAIGRLNLQQISLQAAQQAYLRLQGLSLFDLL